MQPHEIDAAAPQLAQWYSHARNRPLNDAHDAANEYVFRCESVTSEVMGAFGQMMDPSHFRNLLECSRSNYPHIVRAAPGVYSLSEAHSCALFDRWCLLGSTASNTAETIAQWETRMADLRERLSNFAKQAVREAATKLAAAQDSPAGGGHMMFDEDVTSLGNAEFPRPSCICNGFVVQAWRSRNIGRLFAASFTAAVEEALRGPPIYAPYSIALSYYGIVFTATLIVPLSAGASSKADTQSEANGNMKGRSPSNVRSIPFVAQEASEYLFASASVPNTAAAPETQLCVGADGRIYVLNIICSFAERMYGRHPSAGDVKMIRLVANQLDEAARRRSPGISVTAVAHGLRLPIRWLGRVLLEAKTDVARSLILEDMSARCMRDVFGFWAERSEAAFRENSGAEFTAELWNLAHSNKAFWTKLVLPHVATKFELEKTRLSLAAISIPSVLLLAQMRCGFSFDPIIAVAPTKSRLSKLRCSVSPVVFADRRGAEQKATARSYLLPTDAAHPTSCPASVWFSALHDQRSSDFENQSTVIIDSMENMFYSTAPALSSQIRTPNPLVIDNTMAFLSAIASYALRLTMRAPKALHHDAPLQFRLALSSVYTSLISQFALRDIQLLSAKEASETARIAQLRRSQLRLLFGHLSRGTAQQILDLHRYDAADAGQAALKLSEALVDLSAVASKRQLNERAHCSVLFAHQLMHWQRLFAGEFQKGCLLQEELAAAVRELHGSSDFSVPTLRSFDSQLLHIPSSLFTMYSSARGPFRVFVKIAAANPKCGVLAHWLVGMLSSDVEAEGRFALGPFIVCSVDIVRTFLMVRNFTEALRLVEGALGLVRKCDSRSATLEALRKSIEFRASTPPEVIIQREFRAYLKRLHEMKVKQQKALLIQRVGRGHIERRHARHLKEVLSLQRVGRGALGRKHLFLLCRVTFVQRVGRGWLGRFALCTATAMHLQRIGRGALERMKCCWDLVLRRKSIAVLQRFGRAAVSRQNTSKEHSVFRGSVAFLHCVMRGLQCRLRLHRKRAARRIAQVGRGYRVRRRIGLAWNATRVSTSLLQRVSRGFQVRLEVSTRVVVFSRERRNQSLKILQKVGRALMSRVFLRARTRTIRRSRAICKIGKVTRAYFFRKAFALHEHRRYLKYMRLQRSLRGWAARRRMRKFLWVRDEARFRPFTHLVQRVGRGMLRRKQCWNDRETKKRTSAARVIKAIGNGFITRRSFALRRSHMITQNRSALIVQAFAIRRNSSRAVAEHVAFLVARLSVRFQRVGRGFSARKALYFYHRFNPRRRLFQSVCEAMLFQIDRMKEVVEGRWKLSKKLREVHEIRMAGRRTPPLEPIAAPRLFPHSAAASPLEDVRRSEHAKRRTLPPLPKSSGGSHPELR